MKFRGSLDKITDNGLTGWALLPDMPDSRLVITLRDAKGNPISSTTANNYRNDLAKVGIGDGFHGFTLFTNIPSFYGLSIHLETDDGLYTDVLATTDQIFEKRREQELFWDISNRIHRFNFASAKELFLTLAFPEKNSFGINLASLDLNLLNYEYQLHSCDDVNGASLPLNGAYNFIFQDGSLEVFGTCSSLIKEIGIFVNCTLVKIITTSLCGAAPVRKFKFRFNDAVTKFPRVFKLSVGSNLGCLHNIYGDVFSSVKNPTGDGTYHDALGSQNVIESHGNFVKLKSIDMEWKAEKIEWYLAAEKEFKDFHEIDIFLIYGSLLGCLRDGDFIPHDGDMDVAFFCNSNTPEAVSIEVQALIFDLLRRGVNIQIVGRGGFFRACFNDTFVDVFPIWFSDSRVWLHNTSCLKLSKNDFLPVQRSLLNGSPVNIPQNSELFLKEKYGDSWRVPDVTYKPKPKDHVILSYLQRSNIESDCIKKLQSDLALLVESGVPAGKLILSEF